MELEKTNGALHCSVCNAESKTICRSCNKPFCELHVSSLDSTYCAPCVDFSNTKIESKPLVDDDGVTRKGRQLILTGETWMRNRDIIAKMTEVELEAKLTALKIAVHEAEMVLDFRRIARTQVESEIADRYTRKLGRRRLIGAMDSVHKTNTKISGSPNERVEIAKDALKALKNMGLNKDAIANLLIKMTQKAKP